MLFQKEEVLRSFIFHSVLLLLVFLWSCGQNQQAAQDAPPPDTSPDPPQTTSLPEPEYCIDGKVAGVCPDIPHDITHKLNPGYRNLTETDQFFFDNFSWQMFVGLNWPADAQGNPMAGTIGDHPNAPRVWEFYPSADSVFHVNAGLGGDCLAAATEEQKRVFHLISKGEQIGLADSLPELEINGILQATGQPVIDRNLNFALYDVVLNPTEVTYIQGKGLDTYEGQVKFKDSGEDISFPLGFYEVNETKTGGSVGAIEIKTAWRILDPSLGDDPSRFYTIEAKVVVSAEASDSGEGFCFDATLGLVGFHAIQRTTNPNPQNWMWATFEHVDNAPEAQNAEDPTNTTITITDCQTPTDPGTTRWSFFNSECEGCATNEAPKPPYKWAATPPYARNYATDGKYGTQVVRCWQIFTETQYMNQKFQEQLKGTVWANYMLINTQWQFIPDSPPQNPQSAPTFLTNTTQETYIQIEGSGPKIGSCADCHARAQTTAGQPANFSYTLGLAKKPKKAEEE